MKIAYILEQFPCMSETFILNELLALERLGIELGDLRGIGEI